MRRQNSQLTVGTNQGTGLPNVSMMPLKPTNPNTSGPTPQGHLDNFNADNGAVGANNIATPGANSGTQFGDALTQLYQTQNLDPKAYGNVALSPTLSGGQFPPGAPNVSGVPSQQNGPGPSLANSNGNAASDAIHRLDYINGLPWNLPQGASVNAPTQLAEGPAQPGGMSQFGAILTKLASNAQNARLKHQMNSVPSQQPLNPKLEWPQPNLAGGLR